MTNEERLGVPPMEVVRQLLDENRPLVRLLSGDIVNHDLSGADPERPSGAKSEAESELISVYRGVLELLEILSATSADAGGEEAYER